MNYDDKVTQGFGAVLCTDALVFLGHLGPNAKVSVYRLAEDLAEIKFVGFLAPIVGTVTKLLLTRHDTKLICVTNCGYIYVWDVGEETVNKLEAITYNPLYADGYVPFDARVKAVAVIEPKNRSECADVDLLHNDWPELNVNFYNYRTGQKLQACPKLLGDKFDKKKHVRTLKADNQVVSEGDEGEGQWVAFGTDFGAVHLAFVRTRAREGAEAGASLTLKPQSFAVTESVSVNCIGWRFRSKNSLNLTLLCACSDGKIRCLVLNAGEDELKLTKQASYSYAKAALSGRRATPAATVDRIVCARDKAGVPFVVGACNIVGELGNFDFGDMTTNCVFEGVYQKLLHDASDEVVAFAKTRDFITDLALSPTNRFVVLVSVNDGVYMCAQNEGEGAPWREPVKLAWRSPEFNRFSNN